MFKLFVLLFVLFSIFSRCCLAQDIKIVERTLPTICYYEREPDASLEYIVLHFCSDVVENPKNPYQIDRIYYIFEQYKVSAHYLIDREGIVYKMVDEQYAARHASYGSLSYPPYHKDKLNHHSIGIEMMGIGTKEEMATFFPDNNGNNLYAEIKEEDKGFTEAQYLALNKLMSHLLEKYEIPRNRQHIIGHNEYRPVKRTDPGILFNWSKIGF
jgi:N-acetyl-anhydromuramyl-L-alanine amidase AmpD